ncbi:hypothetical protein GUITHDRAFT_122284 [Guillardia theta CCMP2712]|uniref:Uncharacterized protein n=1 Tax=Guillardia theta (strain CCMP2712) TaxID=905079 RepID=L1I6N2_GUITC|nr:hypothetical protein GUITHDRAFT_122284 [Guillardia theta CCMP2712]EKX31525.1 hypothetical protein GUITHDRAFT_122284 [Guillardia theta CCMP2712]|eukprot:XP_005818505.1 hypothetical protein GUITHDRAFT_122284 [Guillardia theta CCMP2712]
MHNILVPSSFAVLLGGAAFNAAGYNSGPGVYEWKAGGSGDKAFCKANMSGSPNDEIFWEYPVCRRYSTNFSEWDDLDSSIFNFKSITTPVDPSYVDDWLYNVGNGIY